MSLDVYLTYPQEPTSMDRAQELLRANGFGDITDRMSWQMNDDEKRGAVYEANVTHNLTRMADAAGIYRHVWRPDEIGITKAKQLIEPLREGIAKMEADRAHFETFNAPNGWGLYENFVPWLKSYMQACEENPEADISVSR